MSELPTNGNGAAMAACLAATVGALCCGRTTVQWKCHGTFPAGLGSSHSCWALPLLLFAAPATERSMRCLLQQFLDRNLISHSVMTRFEATPHRQFNFVIAEVLMIVLVYGFSIMIVWRQHVALDTATWYAAPAAEGSMLFMRSCGDLTRSNSFIRHLHSSLMLMSSSSEKAGQVNPAKKDIILKSMEMAKVSTKTIKWTST